MTETGALNPITRVMREYSLKLNNPLSFISRLITRTNKGAIKLRDNAAIQAVLSFKATLKSLSPIDIPIINIDKGFKSRDRVTTGVYKALRVLSIRRKL